MRILFLLFLVFLSAIASFAQRPCTGQLIFTEKVCTGDEISQPEQELYRIINEYRASNNLPPIALSKPLSFVANRHLLDLENNIKYLTHGWSNCPYEVKDTKTWNCVMDAPRRLNSQYNGQGFENLYRNLNGFATPVLALEAWKKSPMHNSLILNLEVWKGTKFDAFGIAISGNFAAMWFGLPSGDQVKISKPTKGLGVSFEKTVSGLTEILSIQKESSLVDSEKWVGTSADKTVTLEIYGRQEDISETTMAVSFKLDKKLSLTEKNRGILSTFLQNLTGSWRGREKWIDEALSDLNKNPKITRSINLENKTIEMRVNKDNNLTLLVKPYKKPEAEEFQY